MAKEIQAVLEPNEIDISTLIKPAETDFFKEVPGVDARAKSLILADDFYNFVSTKGKVRPKYDLQRVLTDLERLNGKVGLFGILNDYVEEREKSADNKKEAYDPNNPEHSGSFVAPYPGRPSQEGENGTAARSNALMYERFSKQRQALTDKLAALQKLYNIADNEEGVAKKAKGENRSDLLATSDPLYAGSYRDLVENLDSDLDTNETLQLFNNNKISKGMRALIKDLALVEAVKGGNRPDLKDKISGLFDNDFDLTDKLSRAIDNINDPVNVDLLQGVVNAYNKTKNSQQTTLKERILSNLFQYSLNDNLNKIFHKLRVDTRKQFTEPKEALRKLTKEQAQAEGGYGQRVYASRLPADDPNGGLFVVRSVGTTNGQSNSGAAVGIKKKLPDGTWGVELKPAIHVRLSTEEDNRLKDIIKQEKKDGKYKGRIADHPLWVQAHYKFSPQANRLRLADIVEQEISPEKLNEIKAKAAKEKYKGNIEDYPDYRNAKYLITRDNFIHTDNPDKAMERARKALFGYNSRALNALNASRSDYFHEQIDPAFKQMHRENYEGKTWPEIVKQALRIQKEFGTLDKDALAELKARHKQALDKKLLIQEKKMSDPNYKPTISEMPDYTVLGDSYYKKLGQLAGIGNKNTWLDNVFDKYNAIMDPETDTLVYLSDKDAEAHREMLRAKQASDRKRAQEASIETVRDRYNKYVDNIDAANEIIASDKKNPLSKLKAGRTFNQNEADRRALLEEYPFVVDEERDDDGVTIGGTLRIKDVDENGKPYPSIVRVLKPQKVRNDINVKVGNPYASVRGGMAKYFLDNNLLADPDKIPVPDTRDAEGLFNYFTHVLEQNTDNINILTRMYNDIDKKKEKTSTDLVQLDELYKTIEELYEIKDDNTDYLKQVTRDLKATKANFNAEKARAQRALNKARANSLANDIAEQKNLNSMTEDTGAELVKRMNDATIPEIKEYWAREVENYERTHRPSNVDEYPEPSPTGQPLNPVPNVVGKSKAADTGTIYDSGNTIADKDYDEIKAGGKKKKVVRKLREAAKANDVNVTSSKTTKNSDGGTTEEVTVKPKEEANNDVVDLSGWAQLASEGFTPNGTDMSNIFYSMDKESEDEEE